MNKVKVTVKNYEEFINENVWKVFVQTRYDLADKILYVFFDDKKVKIPFKDILEIEIE